MANEWTYHGGRLSSARAAYPQAPEPWIDLSTGINPHRWDADRAGPVDWGALPDEAALGALVQAAAAAFGVDPARVRALPGSELGLRQIGLFNTPGPARHVAPGYRSHAAALPASRPIATDALIDEAAQGGTILFANPNNPDGRILPRAALHAAVDAAVRAGGWLVVDEAFADACPGTSILPGLDPAAPVIVLRSFGKFFGLAGLRLGFAIAPADRLAALDDRLGSWPVSTAAIQIGTAAYRDRGWIAATRTRLGDDAAALDAVLRRHGFAPVGDCPLFRLIETDDAAGLFDRLARHGILTRPFDYAPRWLRLGLPDGPGALARLDRALQHG
ncbi:aminotransferase [Sphingomonas sp. KC8]|nr:threonine-phosphate decarboxylase [Sphingomonas sp. KC8]ARS27563.1 aminotransferase [Sphingomonas sp. KC8]